MTTEQTFPALLSALYDMLQFVEEAARQAGFTEGCLSQIELATEEVVVNIIRYAYPQSTGTITLKCQPTPQGLTITFIDQGLPYNPLQSNQQNKQQPSLEKDTLGGYGILLFCRVTNEQHYTYQDGCNILALTKYL